MKQNAVLIYCPTYQVNGEDQIRPETAASIHALNFRGRLQREINPESKYPSPDYRNVLWHYQKARQMALEGGYDGLMTVEHDMILPPEAVQKLWDTDSPVAYGIYLFRGHRHVVNAFRLLDQKRPNMAAYREKLSQALRETVIETVGSGFGCLLIRREVLEVIDFRTTEDCKAPDFPFAWDCQAAGIRQVAHFGVQCGHIIDNRALYLDTTFADRKRDISHQAAPWVRAEAAQKRLTIAVYNRRQKADGIKRALWASGQRVVEAGAQADALLIDHDMNQYAFRSLIDPYYHAGKAVFLYPHGAAPILSWDGIHRPYEAVTANLVMAPGHAEVMRRYGYNRPIQVIGWYYCEKRPFQPLSTSLRAGPSTSLRVRSGCNILFGPIHPMKGGSWSYPEDAEANRKTFERLLKLRGVKIKVRYIGNLAAQGLWEVPGVEYVQVRPTNNTDDIDQADVIIANGTLAYLAIARGKPTIMLNQFTGARDLLHDTVVRVASLDKYADYMRYPYDVDDGDNLRQIIKAAGKYEPTEWIRLFIGDQLIPDKFSALMANLIQEKRKKEAPAPIRQAAVPKQTHLYYVHRHQGKEKAYLEALHRAGYHPVQRFAGRIDFSLHDLDGRRDEKGEMTYLPEVLRMHKTGVPIFLYPHSARPMVQWDGILTPWPYTRCTFVIGPGHREIMKRFGYPIKTEIAGWSLCPILPFRPINQVKNILFGPIHPGASGNMADIDLDINRRAFARLIDYCKASGAKLTVRHIQTLDRCGLRYVEGANYIRALPDGSTAEIDQADLVVGHQTFAYLAIARGVPTLMMGEDVPPHSGTTAGSLRFAAHWEDYADYMMYPLDLLSGNTSNEVEHTAELVERARRGDNAVEEWKSKFIGHPFIPAQFIEKLEGYL